jgi:hypothetical protein
MSAEQTPGPKQAAAPPPEEPPPGTSVGERVAAARDRGKLKDHKVLQWAIAYLGAALAIAQAYELVANAFGWPNGVTRAVVLTLIVGFPIALTVAWYHGTAPCGASASVRWRSFRCCC